MSTNNICLYGEIRKISLLSRRKNDLSRTMPSSDWVDTQTDLGLAICLCLMASKRGKNTTVHALSFTVLWADSADDKLICFLILFPENSLWHFMQIVSLETISMKCQSLFSGKNQKNKNFAKWLCGDCWWCSKNGAKRILFSQKGKRRPRSVTVNGNGQSASWQICMEPRNRAKGTDLTFLMLTTPTPMLIPMSHLPAKAVMIKYQCVIC